MSSTPSTAAWQVGPVSVSDRIASKLLLILAVGAIAARAALPFRSSVAVVILTAIPLLVAVRLIRGFPASVSTAAATFGGYALLAIAALTTGGVSNSPEMAGALSLAAIASGLGLVCTVPRWISGTDRPIAVIELAQPEAKSGLARVRVRAR